MGYHIFIRQLLSGETIVVDGDGTDSRSNTFVKDCVQGLMLAFKRPDRSVGETFNIGGGEEVNVIQVLAILEELTGKTARIVHGPPRPGDQRRTVADVDKARARLGYLPSTGIREGLRAQIEWQQRQMEYG